MPDKVGCKVCTECTVGCGRPQKDCPHEQRYALHTFMLCSVCQACRRRCNCHKIPGRMRDIDTYAATKVITRGLQPNGKIMSIPNRLVNTLERPLGLEVELSDWKNLQV